VTAIRICRSCDHESDLYEAAPPCCGSRDIDTAWTCDECQLRTVGTQVHLLSIGWEKSGKRHVCFCCSGEKPKTTRRVKTKKTRTKDEPGGLFGG
jgi:hypothetical protein